MNTRILVGLLAALAFGTCAAQAPAPIETHCSSDGIALGGYDVLSYFSAHGPVRGDPRFRAEHGGLTYLFASDAARAAFLARPEDYLPAYGGWCATTVAHGSLVCPDYSNFKIEDGRLLLFETTAFTNGRAVWESDPDGYRRRADSFFARLLGR